MNHLEEAKRLLSHYLDRGAGRTLGVDELDEIESIVDLIIDATIQKIELQKLDRLVAEEMEWTAEDQAERDECKRLRAGEKETSLTPLQEVQKAVDAAATAICTLHQVQWAGWVSYLLEAIEANPNFYGDDPLYSVQAGLTARLDTGRW